MNNFFHIQQQKQFTLPCDGIKWKFKDHGHKIIAIGDIHGDLEALASILLERKMINTKGKWIGGKSHLVLNGDLAGGKQVRLLISFIMRLEKEAFSHKGYVHPLLGNHDLFVFRKKRKELDGKTLYSQFPVTGAFSGSIKNAFQGHTSNAEWLARRNAVVRIGKTIFAHAGLNTWALNHSPGRVNATIRGWIRYWQNVGSKPDESTSWTVSGDIRKAFISSTGPIWTRSFKPGKKQKIKNQDLDKTASTAPDMETLIRILKKYHTSRMVLGHAPVKKSEIMLSHPYYGNHVIMIDTKISDQKNGRLSCLEITGDQVQALYFERSDEGKKIVEKELKRLKKKYKKNK
ncbi:MAG: metallophosphoesterase [Spirochaetes bacterium]|nr:metallophosphoesterase [Spirochaetota bacterium]